MRSLLHILCFPRSTLCPQSIHVLHILSPSLPFISPPVPAPAAGLGSTLPVPSIIPRQEYIKDSSLQLNLKGKTMTPGIAAELWRPPIKLFAFDLILSFLPPRWMWMVEHMDTRRHTQTTCCHTLFIPFLLTLATSFPLSYKHKFALMCSLYSIVALYSLSPPLTLSFCPSQAHKDTHRRIQEQNTNRTNNSKSVRRWWWNNYVKTVLPVPCLHTKWLSGTINFTPAISHTVSAALSQAKSGLLLQWQW